MEVKRALKRQYHAGLLMLRQAIEVCPEDVWQAGDPPRSYWRIVYHTLFFTHFYLQVSSDDLTPWEHHVDEVVSLWEVPKNPIVYSKDQMLEYWEVVEAEVDVAVDRMDLSAETSGFDWYKMPKLDHQLVNIRHLQQHAGQLSERLMAVGIDTNWFGDQRPRE